MKEVQGSLSASGAKFGIVLSRFNDLLGENLLKAALSTLKQCGADDKHITVVRVPGAFEIGVTLQRMADSKKYDALIALGIVIRGATLHYELVCSEVAKACSHVSLHTGVPVAFGVLTTDTIEQATERCGTKAGNKGHDAALCAIEMASLAKQEL